MSHRWVLRHEGPDHYHVLVDCARFVVVAAGSLKACMAAIRLLES
jgi:hypothetical protein